MRGHLASRCGRQDAKRREPGGGADDVDAVHQGDSLVVDDAGQLGVRVAQVNTRAMDTFHSSRAWRNGNIRCEVMAADPHFWFSSPFTGEVVRRSEAKTNRRRRDINLRCSWNYKRFIVGLRQASSRLGKAHSGT